MKRSELILCIGIFFSVFILYESMAPVRLSSANFGSDGGDYLAAVLTHGIPHPTGYPLYLILSAPFQNLNSTSVVWKQSQLSIVFAALAALIIFLLVRVSLGEMVKNKVGMLGSLTASLLIAIAPLFWSQAVIIEVYALNAFFISLALFWFIIVIRNENRQNKLFTFFIIPLSWLCGLGLGNHFTYALIYPLVILGLWRMRASGIKTWVIILCAIGWFSGLLTYLVLPLRAQLHPAVNWGDPETFAGFLWLIKGGNYHNLLFGIQLHEYPARILSWVNLVLKQFGVFGLLAGLAGITDSRVKPLVRWSTLYLFFVFSIFAIGYKTNDSMVYIIPSLIAFALWCGWGIHFFWEQKWKKINIGLVLSLAIIINMAIVFPSRYRSVAPTNDDLARYAEVTLAEAQENATIFTDTDGQTFSLWFYQYGLGMRPDVRIISKGLLQYAWYQENLLRLYPGINLNELE
jgi:hypothetical protein